jgi:hypothetical protein
VRDAALLEDRGIPAIALIHDVFKSAAELQAALLGRPDLTLVIFPQGKPEQSDQDVDSQARGVLERVLALLAVA